MIMFPELQVLREINISIKNMTQIPEAFWTPELQLMLNSLCKEALVYQQEVRDVMNPTKIIYSDEGKK